MRSKKSGLLNFKVNDMGAFEYIIYEKKEGIAWITLNRPKAMNAVNIRMRDELYEVLPAIKDDPEVKVAILKGAGDRAFSVGADISEFGTTPSQTIARQVRWERDLWGMFLSVQKPLIAAINGFALGAGIEMAMCCDIRIATENSQFGLPEANLGMVPTAGGSQTMPRLVLHGHVSHIVLTAERIDANEALRIGLINRVVPSDQLVSSAESIASDMMSNDSSALQYAKEAITRGLDMPLHLALEMECRLATTLRLINRNG